MNILQCTPCIIFPCLCKNELQVKLDSQTVIVPKGYQNNVNMKMYSSNNNVVLIRTKADMILLNYQIWDAPSVCKWIYCFTEFSGNLKERKDLKKSQQSRQIKRQNMLDIYWSVFWSDSTSAADFIFLCSLCNYWLQ